MEDRKIVKKHRRKTGIYIAAAAAAIVLLAANWLAQTAEKDLLLRADMTRDQHTVLSGGTKGILGELKKDIYIYYVSATGQDVLTDGLLQSYDAASPRVHYSVTGEESLPKVWKDAGAVKRSVVVSDAEASSLVAEGSFDVLDYEDLYTDEPLYAMDGGFRGESAITPAIMHVAEGSAHRVVFLTGEGEADPNGSLLGDIEELYYEAKSMPADTALGPGSDTLIVLSPKEDISSEGLSNIKSFLDAGGSASFFIGGDTVEAAALENVRSLLVEYGISIGDEIILGGDPSHTYLSPANIMSSISGEAAALGLSSMPPILCYARPITITQVTGVEIAPLLWTDESCFLKDPGEFGFEKEPGDREGSFLAGALARKGDTSVVVITSSSFAVSEESYSYQGNSELFIGILKIMSKEQQSYYAQSGSETSIALRQSMGRIAEPAILIAAAALLPVVILAAGLARWRKRKKQ